MGKPQTEPLRELAETERAALQQIVCASSERVDRVPLMPSSIPGCRRNSRPSWPRFQR